MDEAQKKKLEAQFQRLEKWHGAVGEILADIRAVLDAEPTKGALVKRLFGFWSGAWPKRYRGEAYVYGNNAAVAGGFGRLLKQLDVAEIERRMTRFLESSDPFYVEARHPVEMFIKAVNKFGAGDADDEAFLTAPVINCRHTPPCKSDQEHTRREQNELRGR